MSTLSNTWMVLLMLMVFLVLSLDTVHGLRGTELNKNSKDSGYKNTVYLLSIVRGGNHSCHGVLINNMKTIVSTRDCLSEKPDGMPNYVTGGLDTNYAMVKEASGANKRGFPETVVTAHECPVFNIAIATVSAEFTRGTSKQWDLEFTNTIRNHKDVITNNEHGIVGRVYSYGEADENTDNIMKREDHKINWVEATIVKCKPEDLDDVGKISNYGKAPQMVLCTETKSTSDFTQCSDDAGAPFIIHAKVYGLLLPRAPTGKCVKGKTMVFVDITKHDCWLKKPLKENILGCGVNKIEDISTDKSYWKKCKASGFLPSSTLVIFFGIILTIIGFGGFY